MKWERKMRVSGAIQKDFNLSDDAAVEKVKAILEGLGYPKDYLERDLKNERFVWGVLASPEIVEMFKESGLKNISDAIVFGNMILE